MTASQASRFTERTADVPVTPERPGLARGILPPDWMQPGNMLTLQWAGPPTLNVQVEYAEEAGNGRYVGRVVSWDEVAGDVPLKVDQKVEFEAAQIHWVEPGAAASS